MTKKSFINPAMNFISGKEKKEEPIKKQEEFINPAEINPPPEGFKINPLYIEKKERRLQLLIQQSLYKKIKAQAKQEKQSINNFIHLLLEEALKEKEQ